jgi:hypothetical protein
MFLWRLAPEIQPQATLPAQNKNPEISTYISSMSRTNAADDKE